MNRSLGWLWFVLAAVANVAHAEEAAETARQTRCGVTPPERVKVVDPVLVDPVAETLMGYSAGSTLSPQMKLVFSLAEDYAEGVESCVTAILSQGKVGDVDVRAMQVDIAKASAALDGLRAVATHPMLLGQPAATTMYLRGKLASLEVLHREAAQRTATLRNQYGVYAGLAYSLAATGSLIPGAEIQFRLDNQVSRPDYLCPKTLRFLWCRRFTEISYQTIAAVDAPQITSGASGGGIGGGGVDPDGAVSAATQPSNPFVDAGGYFRFNTGVKAHFYDWIGLAAGVGLSSAPTDIGDRMRFRPRGFVGLSTLTMHGDGAQSQLMLGYAYDEFWQREQFRDPLDPAAGFETIEEFDRVILDGVLMIPGLRPAGFSVAARLWVDTPADFGDGPSEARASLLFYQDFSGWTKLFNPLRTLGLPLDAPGS